MAKNSIAGEPSMGYEPQSLQDADKVMIVVRGVPADNTSAFRGIISDDFSSWILTPSGPSEYHMTMKPTEAGNMKKETLARSISTIENRINSLGLSEATVQERQGSGADAEILVSLPGTDDPDRIKSILKTAALLELYEVKSGPFKSEVDALSSFNGVKPLGTKLMPSMKKADAQDAGWYVVNSTPVITGRDLRDARASQDEMARRKRVS